MSAFVLGVYLLGMTKSFGKINHSDGLIAMTLGILALSRCGDAFSIDAWLARRRGRPRPNPSGEYTWPIRAIWLCLALVFLNAGISKMRHGGLDWIVSDQFSYMIASFATPEQNPGTIPELAALLARQGWLCHIAAFTTVLFELAMPLALFFRWARAMIVPIMLGLQISMGVVMVGPNFAGLLMS